MKAPHPGQLVAEAMLRADLSIEQAAALLEMQRTNLSPIIYGRKGIGPRLALRIEAVLSIDAGDLVCAQARFDLSRIRKNSP